MVAHLVTDVWLCASVQHSAQATLAAIEGCQMDGGAAGLHGSVRIDVRMWSSVEHAEQGMTDGADVLGSFKQPLRAQRKVR